MSLDDWRWDHGWRGTAWEVGRFVWTLARIALSLAVMALVLWAGVSWVAETFAGTP